MIYFKKGEKFRTQQEILYAVRMLREASSSKILEFIVKGLSKSKPAKSSKLPKDSISLRTIQRNLAELKDKGLLIQNGLLYSLADEAKAARFFGSRFGQWIFYYLIGTPDYELRTVKENLKNLITLFGTIITFCCMEAARPKKTHMFTDGKGKPDYAEQLDSTVSWINSTISPSSLFHYFLFVFRNQIDDEKIRKLRKLSFYGLKRGKHIWVDEKTGKEYDIFQFASMHPFFIDENEEKYSTKLYRDIPFRDEYLHLDRFSSVTTDYNYTPYDEVEVNTYDRMVKAFRDLVPDLSSKLEGLRINKDRIMDFKEGIKVG